MTHPHPRSIRRPIRRIATILFAAAVGLGVSALTATPAAGDDSVGYVRLAHLSPDTPEVDVYLSKVGDSSFARQKFGGVGYGVMSEYLKLPVGTYAVSMRLEGRPESEAPVLTTQVTVEGGQAYTVAGVGRSANLGLKILNDDLSRPAPGRAKVRVIQASVGAPVLDVSLTDGTSIATGVEFATTTPYQIVPPGTWRLQLKPTGTGSVSTVSATLRPGNVYSLLVLDSGTALKAELRLDAAGGVSAPDGAVATGAGGAAEKTNALAMIALGLGVLLVLVAVALRMRRLASRRS